MSLVKTPADDSKTAAAEDHEVAAVTKSGRPTTKDAALLAFVSSIGPFAANAYVPAFDEIGQHYGVGLVTVHHRPHHRHLRLGALAALDYACRCRRLLV
ncbi:hypothetical protein [Sutterella wadsworthensis]|uniref:hypothetical protein n=1 Tax=Sutterella wadsworthensis TaxID=40545 RepID=UPI001F112CC4|nr:hypothetical protein [Sutterella wadsworthensis]